MPQRTNATTNEYYNQKILQRKMLQRTNSTTKDATMTEFYNERCYNERILQRTMLQRTNATTNGATMNEFYKERCYNERILQRKTLQRTMLQRILQGTMLQRNNPTQNVAATNSFYQQNQDATTKTDATTNSEEYYRFTLQARGHDMSGLPASIRASVTFLPSVIFSYQFSSVICLFVLCINVK